MAKELTASKAVTWLSKRAPENKIVDPLDEFVENAVARGRRISAAQRRYVRGLLEKTIEAYQPGLAVQTSTLRAALEVGDLRLLTELFEDLSINVATDLLGTAGVAVLLARCRAADLIADPLAPLYRQERLNELLAQFIKFLDEHRKYLVLTGLPPKYFSRSPWLYAHLGRLYDTRQTSSPYCLDELDGRRRHVADFGPYTFLSADASRPRSPGQASPCRWEEASFLLGLASSDGRRLEDLRAAVFDAKQAALKTMIDAEREGPLGKRVCEQLVRRLHLRNVMFLISMDEWYLGKRTRPSLTLLPSREWSPGGLLNLMTVAGHVEAERETGAFSEAAQSVLHRAAASSSTKLSKSSWQIYFGWRRRFGKEVDEAIDRFIGQRREAKAISDWLDGRVGVWTSSPIGTHSEGAESTSISPGKPAKLPNEPEHMFIAVLLQHHGFAGDVGLEPIGCRQMAKTASMSSSTASELFKRHFGSHAAYIRCCQDHEQLAQKLRKLEDPNPQPERQLRGKEIAAPSEDDRSFAGVRQKF